MRLFLKGSQLFANTGHWRERCRAKATVQEQSNINRTLSTCMENLHHHWRKKLLYRFRIYIHFPCKPFPPLLYRLLAAPQMSWQWANCLAAGLYGKMKPHTLPFLPPAQWIQTVSWRFIFRRNTEMLLYKLPENLLLLKRHYTFCREDKRLRRQSNMSSRSPLGKAQKDIHSLTPSHKDYQGSLITEYII